MKQEKNHYTPQEFARLFHIDKQTLIYYDNQGIFSPAFRSEKGYRYYETAQILPFAELLSLRNLHISGAEMGVFNQHPSRSKLIELLSDKVMEQEEAIRAMQSNIESLKRKIRHLTESRSHPMEQVMLIPKPVRLMQRSPLFPAKTSFRDACQKSALLITEYAAHLFDKDLEIAVSPAVDTLSALCEPYAYHLLLISPHAPSREMENPLTLPAALYLTYIFPSPQFPLPSAVLSTIENTMQALSLSPDVPFLVTPRLDDEGRASCYRLEIPVTKKA